LSVSNDLLDDAVRDLTDIGASELAAKVHSVKELKYGKKISSKRNGRIKWGVLFSTYSALIAKQQSGARNIDTKQHGKGKYNTRFDQIVHWLGTDFAGVIIFDECHKAKNLCPVGSGKSTQTGQIVLQLQEVLPKARIVYASATGASEPRNMAYMIRLGMWGEGTSFKTFKDFISALESQGVSAMELVAMDMKQRGMYIARQLSFQKVTFCIVQAPMNIEFIDLYNRSVRLVCIVDLYN